MKYLLSLIILCNLNWNTSKPKQFPTLKHETVKGKIISNDYFKENEKTLVIHFFLGCLPSINVLKDLQTLEKQEKPYPKVLLIIENTSVQFLDFNDTTSNPLSKIRRYFDIQPITYDVIAECENNTQKIKNGNIILGSECRKLGRKLKIKGSPTLLLVNSNNEIIKRQNGYFTKPNAEKLLEWLNQ